MIMFTRKYGSQRTSKNFTLTIDDPIEDTLVFYSKEEDKYTFLKLETDEEWKAMLSLVHRAYRRFNDVEERKQQLQML